MDIEMRKPQDLAHAFRQAMRLVPGAVFLLTSQFEGQKGGMTATAVTSLCADPPSVLACVNRAASLFALISGSGRFALSLLGQEHKEIAMVFGGIGSRNNRFEQANWTIIDTLPVPSNAVFSFSCKVSQHMDFGTHRVFAAEIIDLHKNSHVDPLLYVKGSFA